MLKLGDLNCISVHLNQLLASEKKYIESKYEEHFTWLKEIESIIDEPEGENKILNMLEKDDLSWFCNSYDEKRNKIKPIKEMYKPKLTPSRSPLSRIDGTTPKSSRKKVLKRNLACRILNTPFDTPKSGEKAITSSCSNDTENRMNIELHTPLVTEEKNKDMSSSKKRERTQDSSNYSESKRLKSGEGLQNEESLNKLSTVKSKELDKKKESDRKKKEALRNELIKKAKEESKLNAENKRNQQGEDKKSKTGIKKVLNYLNPFNLFSNDGKELNSETGSYRPEEHQKMIIEQQEIKQVVNNNPDNELKVLPIMPLNETPVKPKSEEETDEPIIKKMSTPTIKGYTKAFEKSPEFKCDINEYYSSDDESEESHEEKGPEWTSKENLYSALRAQSLIDPDSIFGTDFPKTCDLEKIFGKRKFRTRSSSANWTLDKLNPSEENEYKRLMGYKYRL